MDNLIWLWVVSGIIAIAVSIKFCVEFMKCADEKGYNGTNYFWVCFFFGVIGYMLVAALPDKRVSEMIRSSSAPAPTSSASTDPSKELAKFKELMDNGTITEEEYNAKKRELLQKM